MPSVDQNLSAWDYYYKRTMDGEPWSAPWGSFTAEWYSQGTGNQRRWALLARAFEEFAIPAVRSFIWSAD